MYAGFMVVAMSVASLPLEPQTLLAVKVAPPWLLASIGALAAAAVAPFDHWFVRRAFRVRLLDDLRKKKLFQRAEVWANASPFFTTFGFAALPLPFMFARVLVPLSGYSRGRYALAVALGRFPRVYTIAALGLFFDIPTRWLLIAIAVCVGFALLTVVGRRLYTAVRGRRGDV